jgi:hypothetical protein
MTPAPEPRARDAGRVRLVVLAAVLAAAAGGAPAVSTAGRQTASWRLLPSAPVAFPQSETGVWTGRQLVLVGRGPAVNPARNVAAAYDPRTNRWRKLAPPRGPDYVPGFKALWTGSRMLAFDPFDSLAYVPAVNAWRTLPRSINLGFLAWTGREAIGWGGGCCGDAQADGSAYDPAHGTYRKLPASPLGAAQGALGAWTGRELILFTSGFDVDGHPYPASVARAAAYTPRTNTWRRLAPLPLRSLRTGTGVWDGRELLVVGAGAGNRAAFAYDPAKNRWRTLAPLPAGRIGGIGVWAGTRLLLVGGENANGSRNLRDGVAYDPRTNRWTTLPAAPIPDLFGATAVWTGRELLVARNGRLAALTP